MVCIASLRIHTSLGTDQNTAAVKEAAQAQIHRHVVRTVTPSSFRTPLFVNSSSQRLTLSPTVKHSIWDSPCVHPMVAVQLPQIDCGEHGRDQKPTATARGDLAVEHPPIRYRPSLAEAWRPPAAPQGTSSHSILRLTLRSFGHATEVTEG